jgi:hypothetical protein
METLRKEKRRSEAPIAITISLGEALLLACE